MTRVGASFRRPPACAISGPWMSSAVIRVGTAFRRPAARAIPGPWMSSAVTRIGTAFRRPAAGLGAVGLVLAATCGPADRGETAAAFRETARALAAEAEAAGVTTVAGRDGWLFFAPELRHVSAGAFWGPRAAEVSRARRPDAADPLPAIVDFHAQLEAAGVELLVVPVPPKSVVYADRLSPELAVPAPVPRLDPEHRAFYAQLRDAGVEVLDLTEGLLANRDHPEGPVYCRYDTHWSGVGCVLAGREIAAAVRARPWFRDLGGGGYETRWRDAAITGDLTHELAEKPPAERLRLREVRRADAPWRTAAADPDSPIVLLGDSHNLVFHAGGDMHATGAGLPEQLAFELGAPVDLVAVRGAASTAARVNLFRRAQRDPGYWRGKRLVVWCFSAREFTEGDGWPIVPIRP